MPGVKQAFSPVLQLQEQQNVRNLEFGREILESSEKSFHFDGQNLEFPRVYKTNPVFLRKPVEFRKFLEFRLP